MSVTPVARSGMFLLFVLRLIFLSVPFFGSVLYVHAEDRVADEYALKASYLTLFTQYTSWPVDELRESNTPIYICVLGYNPFGKLLEQSAFGRIGGAPLRVKLINNQQEAAPCQIVFIAKNERKNEAEWIAALKDKPILTVGESGKSIAHGGTVEFNTEKNRVQFEVNLAAVASANLKINSGMLTYASKVYRVPKVSP